MNHLAVFARPPVVGLVKTRLSPALPPALACDLYRALLSDTLAVAASSGATRCTLFWAQRPAEGHSPSPRGFAIAEQRGPDLGGRLSSAFGELLRGPDDRAVVVGTDCPELTPAVIASAFRMLLAKDLVVGPTLDGGYYLVGLRRPAPELFSGISWGTAEVLRRTLEKAHEGGLSLALLERLADLDTPADLVRLVARSLEGSARVPPHTRDALAAIGLLPRAEPAARI